MDVDGIADARLKKRGRSLPPNDELHLVGEMVDEAVKQRMGVLGTNKVPTPLGAADMQAIADVMSKAAEAAVDKHMAEITHKLDVIADQMRFVTNMVCNQSAKDSASTKHRWWRFG